MIKGNIPRRAGTHKEKKNSVYWVDPCFQTLFKYSNLAFIKTLTKKILTLRSITIFIPYTSMNSVALVDVLTRAMYMNNIRKHLMQVLVTYYHFLNNLFNVFVHRFHGIVFLWLVWR